MISLEYFQSRPRDREVVRLTAAYWHALNACGWLFKQMFKFGEREGGAFRHAPASRHHTELRVN